jgi:hypothetical protein
VKRVVSPYSYELELTVRLRIHPVHHVSLLEPVAGDPLPGQKVTPRLSGRSGTGSRISGGTGRGFSYVSE